jgi:hypothetical protein
MHDADLFGIEPGNKFLMMLCCRNIMAGIATLYCTMIFSQQNNINSTEKNYEKFKGTLTKELQLEAEDTISGNQILHPSSLPSWFFAIPESDQNQIYSIGISDPGMQEDKALEQAWLRAKALTIMMLHPKVTGITDNYSGEKLSEGSDKFTTKYENLYRIASKKGLSAEKFEQQEYSYTSFGEAIVLLKYCTANRQISVDSIEAIAEVYQVERQKNNVFETEEKTNLGVYFSYFGDTLPDKHFNYSIHTLNNLLEISSEIDGNQVPFPYFNFRYIGESDSMSFSLENNIINKLNYGLWKTYLEILIQKILFLSQSYSVSIKQVGDNYTAGNKNLSREIAEADPSFTITGLRIANNYLSLDVDYLNQQQ